MLIKENGAKKIKKFKKELTWKVLDKYLKCRIPIRDWDTDVPVCVLLL